jgi:hypothetical protein
MRIELLGEIAAQVDQQQNGVYLFGYVDLERENANLGECYQPCMLADKDAHVAIWRGIIKYQLPPPKDDTEQKSFWQWCEQNDEKAHHITRCSKCKSLNWSCSDDYTEYYIDTRDNEEFQFPAAKLYCKDCGHRWTEFEVDNLPEDERPYFVVIE